MNNIKIVVIGDKNFYLLARELVDYELKYISFKDLYRQIKRRIFICNNR